jgi:glutamate/tyrosine decarboxylase-like PLP-dependent enzyme
MRHILESTLSRATRYLDDVQTRRVFPTPEAVAELTELGGTLPEDPEAPEDVLERLDRFGSPGTVATAGPRYFGFVTGGVLPAALAANWMAGAWDQMSGLKVASPVAVAVEQATIPWLLDVLGLDPRTAVGFVTGATMANFTGLAAARHALLARHDWNVEKQGLFGAPEIRVVVGDEVHVSLLKALSLLGMGRDRVVRVPVDAQGRMRLDSLPRLDANTLVCIQAGNVNSGAFDPAEQICAAAHEAGAWVHVDGAFGLWALANPNRAHLARGVPDADSWAADAHKWLNVPYDSGLVFCRHPEHLASAMSPKEAAYLIMSRDRDPTDLVPEMSRRARGVEIWAAMRSLGRSGLAELFERNCRQATRFAEGFDDAGYEILNEVELNQVMVSFGDGDITDVVTAGVQDDGTCWCGGTVWQGRSAMRISVCSWATTDADVERSLESIIRVANEVLG